MQREPRKLLGKSRELRRKQTPAEIALWNSLRGRRFLNLKFRRQEEIGFYVVDFCCHELQLIIELDGEPHIDLPAQASDARRTHELQSKGFTVTRIENEEMLLNPKIVFERLTRLVVALRKLPHP